MGNICRSPSGEAVMNKLVKKAGLENEIECDSAGTIAYHEGEPADSRMKRHALRRGYKLTSIARRFLYEDFQRFDYIIAMDYENLAEIKAKDHNNEFWNKVHLMTDFSTNPDYKEVPDPYYGGPEGFENVLDILEDACGGLLDEVKTKMNNN
jgi:protein-tyrosine phosphatase